MLEEFMINVLLLVEDSEDDIIITQRKIFRSTLKINEFIVAKTLNEAIDVIQHKTVDVVLLDLNLPETQGLDTLVALRKVYNGIVIVVTSIDNEMIGVEAIRQGADDYIVKNTMTEGLLLKSIVYARERRKVKEHLHSIKNKLAQLDNITR
jgi:DNA-binding response OmpR family regulator